MTTRLKKDLEKLFIGKSIHECLEDHETLLVLQDAEMGISITYYKGVNWFTVNDGLIRLDVKELQEELQGAIVKECDVEQSDNSFIISLHLSNEYSFCIYFDIPNLKMGYQYAFDKWKKEGHSEVEAAELASDYSESDITILKTPLDSESSVYIINGQIDIDGETLVISY